MKRIASISLTAFSCFVLLALFYPHLIAFDTLSIPDPSFFSWPVHIVTAFALPIVVFVTAVVVFLLLRHKKRLDALLLVLALVWNESFVYIVKAIVERARPSAAIAVFGSSFPSGHAATATVFFGMLAFLCWEYVQSRNVRITATVIAILLVLFVGYTRLYIHVHYITDVLGGFLLGTAVLTATIAFRTSSVTFK